MPFSTLRARVWQANQYVHLLAIFAIDDQMHGVRVVRET
jgi:hypothetical protein